MQHNTSVNMQQQPNLTAPFYFENGSQFNDLESVYSFDDTIDGAAADNYSNLYCPSFSYENITYLNVSCDTALNFSVPLYGEFNDYWCETMTIIDLCFKGTIAPFFILITLIANSAIVVVLSKKNMQTPTNAVLLG